MDTPNIIRQPVDTAMQAAIEDMTKAIAAVLARHASLPPLTLFAIQTQLLGCQLATLNQVGGVDMHDLRALLSHNLDEGILVGRWKEVH